MARLFPRLAALVAFGAAGDAASGPLLGSLRVENVEVPLAVGALAPRFSWVTGGAQENYRIVATSGSGGVLWDSGTTTSFESSMVQWSAAPPPPDTDVFWTVSVTLTGVGLVSASSYFSTAPAPPLPGIWIGGFDTLRASLSFSTQRQSFARVFTSSASGATMRTLMVCA